jgi:hypothetical protein
VNKTLNLLDTDGILSRLNAASVRQIAEIRSRGARDFTELLMVLETDNCPSCDGKAATCKIAAFVNSNPRWKRSAFCPRCFGRMSAVVAAVDKGGNKIADRQIYTDSEFYTQISRDGKGFVVARCNCMAAKQQHGERMSEAAALGSGRCAVRQRFVEEVERSTAVKRWRKDADDENQRNAVPAVQTTETGGSLDYEFNRIKL